jgi:hypothetical protein
VEESVTTQPHGTRAKYVGDRCRCLRCRAANSRYSCAQDLRKRGPWRIRSLNGARIPTWIVQHRDGSIRLKTNDRDQARRRCARLNARVIAQRDPFWASDELIAQVRAHLVALTRWGVSLRRIAHICWLSRTRLLELKHGASYNMKRPRKRRLKIRTAQLILAISPEDISLAAGERVPADETWRLIDELLAAGVTKVAIAVAIGQHRALQVRRRRVRKRTADRIADFHREVFERAAREASEAA